MPPSKKKYSFSSDYDLEPTGKLALHIHDYWTEGLRKNWSDTAKRPLEEQLNEIIPTLVEISIVVREKRLEIEHQTSLRREQEKLRFLETERARQFETDLRNWGAAMEMRYFISEVKSKAAENESTDPKFIRWMEWASHRADTFDPLMEGFTSFMGKYKL